MNKKLYNKLKLETIGMDCFFESLTTSINYFGMDYIALLYTTYSLFYSYDDFIDISINKSPEEYLCISNSLIFRNNKPSTWFFEIYGNYFRNNSETLDLFKYVKCINVAQVNKIFLKEIKNEFLDKDISIMAAISASKLKQEYLSIGGGAALGDVSVHYINLIDVNEDICTIVDPNYKIKGEIPTNSFIDSLYSSDRYEFMYVDPAIKKCEIDLINLLKNNLKGSLSQTVNIDGKKYSNNIRAMNNLINDLPNIIDIFQSRYDIYAHQFLSLVLRPQRHLIRSCGYLYSNLYSVYKMELLKEIGELSCHSGNLWFTLDYVLDKAFLKNEKLVQKKDNLSIILNKILENDKKVIELMNELYNML